MKPWRQREKYEGEIVRPPPSGRGKHFDNTWQIIDPAFCDEMEAIRKVKKKEKLTPSVSRKLIKKANKNMSKEALSWDF